MKLNSKNPSLFRSVAAAVLIGSCGMAFAAGGTIVGITATPATVFVNDTVIYKVSIAEGSYGVDCNARVSVLDSNNMVVKSSNHQMTSQSNNYEYTAQFSLPAPGVYTVEATSGMPSSQTVVCTGIVKATLTVKAKNSGIGVVTPINPIFKTSPIPVNPGNPGVIRKQ